MYVLLIKQTKKKKKNLLFPRFRNSFVLQVSAKRSHSKTRTSVDNEVDNDNDSKRCKIESDPMITSPEPIEAKTSFTRSVDSSTILVKADNVPENHLNNEETTKMIINSTSEDQSQVKSPRTRQMGGRRTTEQRMASTQRWAARKKAILAATGADDSDTDSMGTDNTQLSPVEKIKDAGRLRRFTTTTNNIKSAKPFNFKGFPTDDIFVPRSVHAESIIGDATFVVTSTLHLCEPQYLNQPISSFPNVPIADETYNNMNDETTKAAELYRIQTGQGVTEKTLIERCLNIEVEGTDLEALKKIQNELANFVETDMIEKLANNLSMNLDNEKNTPQDSFQTLEQQLKTIIEKAVRKNLEITRMRRVPMSKITTSTLRGNKIFSSAFIKAAMKSQIFQPKVVLNRIDNNISQPDNSILHQNIDNNCQEICEVEDNTEQHCDTDGVTLTTKAQLQVHSLRPKTETKTDDGLKMKMMRCKKCHEIVKARYVKSHICPAMQHEQMECNICNMIFKTENELKNHLQIHNETKDTIIIDEELYTCFVCDENFVDEELLKNHLQRHCNDANDCDVPSNGTPSFQCAICGENLEFKEALDAHMENHLYDDTEENSSTNSIAVKNDHINDCQDQIKNVHTCLQCSETFESEINLALHMQEHDEDAAIAEWEKQSSKIKEHYSCSICDEKFTSEDTLAEHFKNHNDCSQICLLCDQPCASLAELRDHVHTH